MNGQTFRRYLYMKINDYKFYGIIRDFLTIYLPLQKDSSPNTVKSYREGINLFLTFISNSKGIKLFEIGFDDMTPDNLEGFITWLSSERHCQNTSINQRIAIVRAFLKYAGTKSPDANSYYLQVQQIPFKKVAKELTVDYFSENVLHAILEQPKPQKKTEHRNLFYLILLYDTGARNQEILDLRATNFVTTGKSSHVVIHGKGNKTRSVPIMDKTMEHFEAYIKRVGISRTDTETPLFFTTSHGSKQQMSDDNTARFLKEYAKRAKKICSEVPDNVTPHMFRHSRAIHLYRNGVPLVLISEWLGHSNLETTLIYAYADTEMKRKAIEAATEQNHPLRKKDAENTGAEDDDFRKLYGLL